MRALRAPVVLDKIRLSARGSLQVRRALEVHRHVSGMWALAAQLFFPCLGGSIGLATWIASAAQRGCWMATESKLGTATGCSPEQIKHSAKNRPDIGMAEAVMSWEHVS